MIVTVRVDSESRQFDLPYEQGELYDFIDSASGDVFVDDIDELPAAARQMPIDDLVDVAEILAAMDDRRAEAFVAYLANSYFASVDVRGFEDSFVGVYESFEDAARELAEEIYGDRPYFDLDQFTYDLQCEGWWTRPVSGGVAVFSP